MWVRVISARRSVLGLAALCTAVAACNSGTVDTKTIEQQIQEQVVVGQATVTGVDCPSDVQVEKGGTFNCAVAFSNDAIGKVAVEQLGFAHYTYQLVPGSLEVPGATVEPTIEKQLASQGLKDPQVNCPDNIIVKVGSYVVCDVTSTNGSGSVKFTFSSTSGTVDTSSVEASS